MYSSVTGGRKKSIFPFLKKQYYFQAQDYIEQWESFLLDLLPTYFVHLLKFTQLLKEPLIWMAGRC